MMRGIDVSENNGYVDFDKVKAAGYDFVMVRCSYGQNSRDEYFLDNVTGAHAAGLQCGAYHYGYALTPEQAIREAENCRVAIDEAGVLLELPVFYDMEDADGYKRKHGFDFSADNCTAICSNFVETIGLDCGIYASEGWLNNLIDWQGVGRAVWNASWYTGDDPKPVVGDGQDGICGYMWQYTDAAYIPGASKTEHFDANIIY